jgi:hypothetical protein
MFAHLKIDKKVEENKFFHLFQTKKRLYEGKKIAYPQQRKREIAKK